MSKKKKNPTRPRSTIEAQERYKRESTRQYAIRFLKNADADIIELLDATPKKLDILRVALRDYINKYK